MGSKENTEISRSEIDTAIMEQKINHAQGADVIIPELTKLGDTTLLTAWKFYLINAWKKVKYRQVGIIQ